MRILIHTRFYPSIGGIETVASLLAHQWVELGEEVRVISDVTCPLEKRREFPFPVLYRPNPVTRIKTMRWSEVGLYFNISLKAIWPRLLVKRPLIFSHQSWYWVSRREDRDWRERMKLRVARAGANIHASRAIAEVTGVRGTVVPNPYDDTCFHKEESIRPSRELAFVGRLVSDKGVEILLNAMAVLQDRGLRPKLTIIGDGPEMDALRQLTIELKLAEQVFFSGARSPSEVAKLLRQHEILVVPSLWKEPFGVVALEGAACGCVVLGSDGGGLPEAIGPAGLTFRRGDVGALAAKLCHLLMNDREWDGYRESARIHLEQHQPQSVAMRYLSVMREALDSSRQ